MKTQILAEVEIAGSCESVWKVWEDPRKWPFWDPGYQAVLFEGPFQVGSAGQASRFGEPLRLFTIEKMIEKRGFCDKTSFFGAYLESHHCVKAIGEEKVRVRHTLMFKGPFAFIPFLWMRKKLMQTLPRALKNLKGLIESGSRSPQVTLQESEDSKWFAPMVGE